MKNNQINLPELDKERMAENAGRRFVLYQDIVGCIAADDYKGVNRQYVADDKLIVEVKCRL